MVRSKVKSRSHHDVAHLHPHPMILPSINFLHLIVSEKHPGQTFPFDSPTAHQDTIGENNTPTAIKGCGVKTLRQLLHKGNKSGFIPWFLMYRLLLLPPPFIKSESIPCFKMYRLLMLHPHFHSMFYNVPLDTIFRNTFHHCWRSFHYWRSLRIVVEVCISGEVCIIGEVYILLLKFALLAKFTVSIHGE